MCTSCFFVRLQYVHDFINQTWKERFQTDISEDVLTLLWSTIVSGYTIGGFIGATIGGVLSVKMGRYGQRRLWQINLVFHVAVQFLMLCCISRKMTLLANNIFALTAALLLGLSYPAGLFELLIIGRLFTGINAGESFRNTFQ